MFKAAQQKSGTIFDKKAAALFREAGNLEEGQNCSCAWLLSEIAA